MSSTILKGFMVYPIRQLSTLLERVKAEVSDKGGKISNLIQTKVSKILLVMSLENVVLCYKAFLPGQYKENDGPLGLTTP